MAARRLIAILLVLLFLSSLAAALAPVPETTRTGSSSTSSTEPDGPPTFPEAGANAPRVVSQAVAASAENPRPIRARVGDRLELEVSSRRSGTIHLVGLGPTEDVGPQQPAFFDVFLRDEGSYPVEFLDSGQEVARIEVSAPEMPPATR